MAKPSDKEWDCARCAYNAWVETGGGVGNVFRYFDQLDPTVIAAWKAAANAAIAAHYDWENKDNTPEPEQ